MKKNSRVGGRLLIGLVFLFLYAPILLLVVFSFNAGGSNVVWEGFSLRWYQELFQDRRMMTAVYNTLLVSVLATVISTAVGTITSVGLYGMKKRWREPILSVNNIPIMNADIVTGVSLCIFFVAAIAGWNDIVVGGWNGFVTFLEETFRRTLPRMSEVEMGFATLLLAHLSFDIPYVILNVLPKLRQMDSSLVDAAQDLGCTWPQAFWKVVVPEIKPGIVSGALIAFTMSIDDFVISYFTAGSTSTLSIEIYSMVRRRVSPELNAVSTLLFVTVLVLLLIINVREARLEKRSAQVRTAEK